MEAAYDRARQLLETTGQDKETRSSGGFAGIEKDLPTVGSAWNISFVDRFSSYLGGHNPMAARIDPETEIVWLFDTTAYRPIHVYPHTEQPFQAEFIAAFFKKNTGKDVSKAVANIADKIGLGKDDGYDRADAEKTIAHRLQPFVDTIAPARFVDVTLPDNRAERLGPGGRSAVSEQTIVEIREHHDGDRVDIPATPSRVTPHGPLSINFAGPEGWMVISDIDDSIKVTMTPSPIGILRSTFVSTPTPITGMPELYAQINSLVKPNWFYLSASPYNLYPFLRTFIRAHYPPGPVILREASWMDLSGFLASLTEGTEAYKRTRIEKLHSWLPQRKVLCVGDSTQSDPEAYGDICRMWPGWVKKVFIRKVVDVAEMQHTNKNSDERFEKAFRDVPREIWRTFIDPKELSEEVAKLRS